MVYYNIHYGILYDIFIVCIYIYTVYMYICYPIMGCGLEIPLKMSPSSTSPWALARTNLCQEGQLAFTHPTIDHFVGFWGSQ